MDGRPGEGFRDIDEHWMREGSTPLHVTCKRSIRVTFKINGESILPFLLIVTVG